MDEAQERNIENKKKMVSGRLAVMLPNSSVKEVELLVDLISELIEVKAYHAHHPVQHVHHNTEGLQ